MVKIVDDPNKVKSQYKSAKHQKVRITVTTVLEINVSTIIDHQPVVPLKNTEELIALIQILADKCSDGSLEDYMGECNLWDTTDQKYEYDIELITE